MYILKYKILRKFSAFTNDNDRLSFVSDICYDVLNLVFPNRLFKIEIVLDNKKVAVAWNMK